MNTVEVMIPLPGDSECRFDESPRRFRRSTFIIRRSDSQRANTKADARGYIRVNAGTQEAPLSPKLRTRTCIST
jgi:hypothetical protein